MADRLNWELTRWDWLMIILVLIGGANWGLVGLGNLLGINLDLVALLLGGIPILQNAVYILVGLSALGLLIRLAGEVDEGM